MADVTIGELPSLNTMEADTLIPVEHDGEAKSMAGSVMQSYVYGLVQDDVETISEIIAVGPAGVSPTLSASKVGGTTTVSYTDVDHPTSTVLATINDGTNGVTPTLSSSKSGKTTTVYFTDATHTSGTDILATIQDGADGTGAGDMTKAIYDQDNDGIVDDAEKLGGQAPSYYQTAITASGILKGNGTTVSAATAGTDYVAPSVLGAASGVATLDSNTKVTASQISARLVSFTSNTTLTASHDGCLLYGNSTSARTITIPSTLSAGFECEIMKYNTGDVTVTAASGVSLNGTSAGSKQITERYTSAVLKAISATAWVIQGAIS